MRKTDFVTKMLELGAELEKANTGIQCSMIINDANLLYDNHFEDKQANESDTGNGRCHAQNVRPALLEEKNRVDLAYLTGVFNVVGIDGLHREIARLKKIGKKPHEIFS